MRHFNALFKGKPLADIKAVCLEQAYVIAARDGKRITKADKLDFSQVKVKEIDNGKNRP